MDTVANQPLPLQQVLDVLEYVVPRGAGYMALCPAHNDLKPSLSINAGNTQPVVVKCHAGCEQEAVWAAIKTRVGVSGNGHQTSPPPSPPIVQSKSKVVATYRYENADGSHNRNVLRMDPKSFPQQAPDGSWTVKDIPEVPFHLPQLIAGVKNIKAIYLVEGEKDVLNLEASGFVATCNPGGAGKWRKEFNEYLKGAYVVLIPDWDEPGKKHTLSQYEGLKEIVKDLKIKRAAQGKDISDHLDAGLGISDLIPLTPEDLGYVPRETGKGVITMADVEETDLHWIWDGLIPMGKLSIQDGDPDQGKSMFLIDLAARVSTGRNMLDDSPGIQASNVTLLATEDDLSDTVVPRLRIAGADLKKIFAPSKELRPSFPSGIDKFEQFLLDTQTKLLIIDPLVAYFDEDVKVNSDPAIRRALEPLTEMAQRTGITVVANRHLNKNSTSGASAIMRGGGSIAIAGVARGGWLIGSFPNDPDTKYLSTQKHNLTPKRISLKFKIADGPRIEYLGESTTTANQLVGAIGSTGEESDIAQCRRWLKEYIAPIVEIEANQVIEDGVENGFQPQTIRRAKQDLAIKHEKRKGDGKSVWFGFSSSQYISSDKI